MKKRLLSCILVLVMLLGMIPTAAFAADYSDADPLPGGSYQVGDTYTGTTKPAAPDKTVWAQVGEPTIKDVLTCTETEHTHDESCKTLTCGHVHTKECDSLIVGDWTVCTEDSHYHQNVCKKHCGLTTGYKCKTNGQNFDPFSGHFLVSDDFCYPGTVILASEVIKAYKDGNDFTDDEKAAIKHLIDLIGENVTAFYHHDITRVPLTCGHHTENCYSVTCGMEAHEHDNGCYRQDTVYTWTLKADNNGNNKPDDGETYTVIYDVNGADSGFNNQSTADLAYGTATPKYTNNGGTVEVTPTKANYSFAGWQPNVAEKVTAPASGNTITYTAQWEEIDLNTTVFDLIHVHMDEATTADLNALKGNGAKHVRLESAKYDKVEAPLGYRVMAPIDVRSNANWWTENFAKKVTAQEITNIILAADKIQGSSDKIVIPMDGNEKYDVTLSYESVNFDVYGIDIDEILSKLPNWPTTPELPQLPELPELPDLDLDDIRTIIDLIQALKNMGLDYEKIFRLIEIAIDGVSLTEIPEILEILDGLDIGLKDVIDLLKILEKLDKDDIQKLINILKKIDVKNLASKLNELKNLICGLKDLSPEDLLKILKDLFQNKIPDDALDCMTPDELRELLKGLITKHQYSLSCLCINISKNDAPDAPTDDELKNLLLEKVTVDCDNTDIDPQHPDKTYGWIKDGVTLGPVVETETTWTCTATLAGWVYADAYNNDIGVDHPVTGVDPDKANIILTWDGDEWIPGDGVTFHVNCDKAITVKHTVTFDYNYDSWVVRVLVEDGKTVTAPASGVERTGYVIDGWYLNSEKYDFATAVTSDITLVADWKVDRNNNGIADEYEYLTVIYSDGVANEVIFADQVHDTLLEGDATPAFDGTPSRIGYTFKGWEPEVSETVTESVVYVAQWERNREPITPVGPTAPSVKVKYLNTEDHVAYIIGYENGTIRPRGEITRAEVATIFFRLMTDKARNQYWTTENDFNDVAEGQWFNLAVSTLNAAGVIVDAEYGNFRPNDPITRAELAVMAAQFCTVEGKLPKTSFTDVSKDHWAIDEIKLIEYAGWIEGYPDGTFRPDATITRAEAITIINRMLERAVEDSDMLEGMLTFIDCPTNEWFYEAVQEATNSHDYKRTKEEVEDYGYCYEIWTELEERPDWAAMEKTWLSQH